MRAYLASLAPTGRRTQESALRAVLDVAAPGADGLTVDDFPWEKLRSEHTNAIRAAIVAKYAPRTVNKILAALKGVLKECWRQRLIDEADFRHAADLKGARASDHARAGRLITPDEMRALYAAAQDGGPSAAHDAALLAVLYNCGLRRAEVCALNFGDYTPGERGLIIHGKGSKQREAFLPTAGALRFEAWWRAGGQATDPVFVRWGKRGPGGRLAPDEVGLLVERIRERAGVAPFTSHDFRRTYITTMIERVDLKTVSALVGHSDINTTARYDRRGREDRKKAVTKFPGL